MWILYTIATNSAVVVSISFWSFVIIYVKNGKLSHIYDFFSTYVVLQKVRNRLYMTQRTNDRSECCTFDIFWQKGNIKRHYMYTSVKSTARSYVSAAGSMDLSSLHFYAASPVGDRLYLDG